MATRSSKSFLSERHAPTILPVKSLFRSFFPAFQRDSGATAKKAHERTILIVRFVFEKGRYVVDSEWLQLQLALQCKHMPHSPQVSPGVSSVGRRETLLQER